MKTFEVQLRYRDRNEESVESTVKVDASSLPGAVAKAAREFVKGLDRKQRFDMNKNGLEVTAKLANSATEAQVETSSGATARWEVNSYGLFPELGVSRGAAGKVRLGIEYVLTIKTFAGSMSRGYAWENVR
jgi:hypothetical protein